MKANIDSKIYDAETAELVASYSNCLFPCKAEGGYFFLHDSEKESIKPIDIIVAIWYYSEMTNQLDNFEKVFELEHIKGAFLE